MRLKKISKTYCLDKVAEVDHKKKIDKINSRKFTKRQLTELLFENCFDCKKMSTIPQGAFTTIKVRQNYDKLSLISNMENNNEEKNYFYPKLSQEELEPTPVQYNSKLMNSIWGLYNRYSVHNLKKIIGDDGVFSAV